MTLKTPYYLIDEARMQPTLERIRYVYQQSGAKSVLALKCFSTWCAFDFMKPYFAGTTSSSLYEARLGYEEFGGETHGYSVAYTDEEFEETVNYCDKLIFNSLSQLERYAPKAKGKIIGLRLNPQTGWSHYELSNTVCEHSRLGVSRGKLPDDIADKISGAMFHMNCENHDFVQFSSQIDAIEQNFGDLIPRFDWVSFGGGVAFTTDAYPLNDFCQRLKQFSERYGVQVYLEPGEAAVTRSTSFVTSVVDVIDTDIPTLVVDSGVETHLLDVLVYRFTPELAGATALEGEEIAKAIAEGKQVYRVCGRTCLAGDVFGTYVFDELPALGTQLRFVDTASYSMVKKNYFNGIAMPSIAYKTLVGEEKLIKTFGYQDFKDALG